MRQRVKKLARNAVRELGWRLEGRADGRVCYSQNGEDLLLDTLFESRAHGFYVDVGSYDPTRFSNTYRLYRRGWSGVVIDPMPGVAERFRAMRPRDVAIEAAVSDVDGDGMLHVFEEPAWNTLNAAAAAALVERGYPRLVEKRLVKMRTLRTLLEPHVRGRQVDLLSIDVEGHEAAVLRSHDWDAQRPRVVAIEVGAPAQRLPETAEARFLIERGYVFQSQTYYTAFFIDERPRAT